MGLIGENGAGKSTTINMICGNLQKDSGEIIVNGYNLDTDLQKTKSQLGVVYQNSVLDKSLSVKENLESRGSLYGIFGKDLQQRIKEL